MNKLLFIVLLLACIGIAIQYITYTLLNIWIFILIYLIHLAQNNLVRCKINEHVDSKLNPDFEKLYQNALKELEGIFVKVLKVKKILIIKIPFFNKIKDCAKNAFLS